MTLYGVARRLQSRAGTTAVEFALLALPFLLLVTGIMDASRLVWTNFSLQFAVEAAARCTAVTTTTCGPQAMTAPGAATFTYNATASCGASITGSQVSGTMPFFFTVTGFPVSVTLNAMSCRPT